MVKDPCSTKQGASPILSFSFAKASLSFRLLPVPHRLTLQHSRSTFYVSYRNPQLSSSRPVPSTNTPTPSNHDRPHPEIRHATRCRPVGQQSAEHHEGPLGHHEPHRPNRVVHGLILLLPAHGSVRHHLLLPLHHLWEDAPSTEQGCPAGGLQCRQRLGESCHKLRRK